MLRVVSNVRYVVGMGQMADGTKHPVGLAGREIEGRGGRGGRGKRSLTRWEMETKDLDSSI